MKRFLPVFALCASMFFIGCSSSKDEVDLRENFVGTYYLNVTSDVKMSNGTKTVDFPMDATDKNFVVTLNSTNKNKVNISGYYGNTTATINGNKLEFDEDMTVTDYISGVYMQIEWRHGPAEIKNNTLTWSSVVTGAVLDVSGKSSSTVVIAGTLQNTANKK